MDKIKNKRDLELVTSFSSGYKTSVENFFRKTIFLHPLNFSQQNLIELLTFFSKAFLHIRVSFFSSISFSVSSGYAIIVLFWAKLTKSRILWWRIMNCLNRYCRTVFAFVALMSLFCYKWKSAHVKSYIHFCYIFSMFVSESESDKFWLFQKGQVHFQVPATVHLVYFRWIQYRLSHREYLVHWKFKQMNEHWGYPFVEHNIQCSLMVHQVSSL